MIEIDDISNSNECLSSECGHLHFGEICQHCHHDDRATKDGGRYRGERGKDGVPDRKAAWKDCGVYRKADGKNSGKDQGGDCHDVELDIIGAGNGDGMDQEGAVNRSGMDLGGAGHGGGIYVEISDNGDRVDLEGGGHGGEVDLRETSNSSEVDLVVTSHGVGVDLGIGYKGDRVDLVGAANSRGVDLGRASCSYGGDLVGADNDGGADLCGRLIMKHYCFDCQKVYKNRWYLLQHKSKVHGPRIPCGQCSQMFSNSSNLSRHVRTAHSEKEYLCEKCGKNYRRLDHLKRHTIGCKSEKSKKSAAVSIYKCNYCDKVYKWSQSLSNHVTKKHRIKTKVGFILANTILSKYKKKEDDFICTLCPYSMNFANRYNLERHSRVKHNGRTNRIYSGSSFIQISEKEKSLLRQKKVICDICKKVFSCEKVLISHRRIVHNSQTPYHCKLCTKKFSCMKFLKAHLNVHTKLKKRFD